MKLSTGCFTGNPEMDEKLHKGEEVSPVRKTIKVKFGVHVSDGGDGSVGVTLYRDKQLAEAALEHEMEAYGQAYMDGGATSCEIEIDVETGEIVAGVDIEVEKDDEN